MPNLIRKLPKPTSVTLHFDGPDGHYDLELPAVHDADTKVTIETIMGAPGVFGQKVESAMLRADIHVPEFIVVMGEGAPAHNAERVLAEIKAIVDAPGQIDPLQAHLDDGNRLDTIADILERNSA